MLGDFPIIRYEHYVAARTLMFGGSAIVAGILFGYSIEAALKEALDHVANTLSRKENQLRLSGHDISKLFQACKNHGIFLEVQVSKDFLLFANDHFDQRYPSRRKAVLNRSLETGVQLSFGVGHVFAYDDLLCQLEDSLFTITGNPYDLSGFQAALHIDTITALTFFHRNAAALSRFTKFARLVQDYPWSDPKTFERLSKGPDHYWNFEGRLTKWGDSWSNIVKRRPAFNFQYSHLQEAELIRLRKIAKR